MIVCLIQGQKGKEQEYLRRDREPNFSIREISRFYENTNIFNNILHQCIHGN